MAELNVAIVAASLIVAYRIEIIRKVKAFHLCIHPFNVNLPSVFIKESLI
jgi:hypothetical protein